MQAALNHILIVFGAAIFFAAIYIGAHAYIEWKENRTKNKYKKMFGIK